VTDVIYFASVFLLGIGEGGSIKNQDGFLKDIYGEFLFYLKLVCRAVFS